jgi:uncharacterized membrane protein YkoI
MKIRLLLSVGGLVLALSAPQVATADEAHCLSREQQRQAIATGRAVPLGVAIRNARSRLGGEVVRARLCDGERGLVYLLTVLRKDGKVVRATVQASSGQLTSKR